MGQGFPFTLILGSSNIREASPYVAFGGRGAVGRNYMFDLERIRRKVIGI